MFQKPSLTVLLGCLQRGSFIRRLMLTSSKKRFEELDIVSRTRAIVLLQRNSTARVFTQSVAVSKACVEEVA